MSKNDTDRKLLWKLLVKIESVDYLFHFPSKMA